ncbi:NBAS protein, partial [Polyodon spathula]|nr:NBAS protein [Polyodon spathula]
MVKLTRHTGHRNPPVSDNHWKGLLQDLQDMQQIVYNCLDQDTCDENRALIFGHAHQWLVWRRKKDAYAEKNLIPTVKYGGGSLLCGCFASTVPGVLVKVIGSSDLNSIENLWFELKRAVHKRRLKDTKDLERFCMEEWSKIPSNVFSNLINYRKRLNAIILARGGSTENKGANNCEFFFGKLQYSSLPVFILYSFFLVIFIKGGNNFEGVYIYIYIVR